MPNRTEAHFERAGDQLRKALIPIQDCLFHTIGIAGIVIVAINSLDWIGNGFELPAHPQEMLQAVLLGTVMIAIGAGRLGVQWWSRRQAG